MYWGHIPQAPCQRENPLWTPHFSHLIAANIPYFWHERGIEFVKAAWSQGYYDVTARSCFLHEADYVYTKAAAAKWLQQAEAAAPKRYCAFVVAAGEVVKADADLENALVEIAQWVGLPYPDKLQGLVGLEELSPVELRHSLNERLRRCFPTACRGQSAPGFADSSYAARPVRSAIGILSLRICHFLFLMTWAT